MEDIYISKRRQNTVDFELTNLDMPPEPPRNQTPSPKKKKKKRRFLRTVATVLLFTFLFSSVFIFLFAAASGYTRNDLKKNEYIGAFDVKNSPLVSNILLMGVDGSAESSSRSDSMILVSLDCKLRTAVGTGGIELCFFVF